MPISDINNISSNIKMDLGQNIQQLDISPTINKSGSGLPSATFGSNRVKTYGIGFTDPRLLFRSFGLSEKNYSKLNRLLSQSYDKKTGFDLSRIKSKDYVNNSELTNVLSNINPLTFSEYRSMDRPQLNKKSDGKHFENIFQPTAGILMNLNRYVFKYNTNIKVIDGYKYENGEIKKQYKEFPVCPSLFNPLYMIQYVGMTSNVPLANGSNSISPIGSMKNTTDCSIRELVHQSGLRDGILGLAKYRYADFMFCKDLGKVSNNHLITLRRFTIPVGDNIFERYNDQSGDVGRLVTWFGTDDNQLENIINFTYNASWKPLNAQIEEINSREDSEQRGIIGMVLNSMNPQYNDGVADGFWGANSVFKYFSTNTGTDNGDMLRNYDKNKVYEPQNTIQDTHIYEGKLIFNHEFTLKFSYELRAYDNINPKSAFLDLIGNILAVTYRRGKFWGGARKFIGPPKNVEGWKKADAFINKTWEKGGNLLSALANGSLNLSNISAALSGLVKQGSGIIGNILDGGLGSLSGTIQDIFSATHLDKAALGIVKNSLGRPALYAMQSLLQGDDVGLWHVTIGNPKNPIVVMGNLIMTNASIQQSGPLGIDDFPTNLTVTVTLKHARGRDAVEIGRMYTKGTNGIYMVPMNKNLENFFPQYSGSGSSYVSKQVESEPSIAYGEVNVENRKAQMLSEKNLNNNDVPKGDWPFDRTSSQRSAFGLQSDHYNQRVPYDTVVCVDAIA